MKARKQWNDIFNVLKEKQVSQKILYPAKLSFKNEGEIKTLQIKTERFLSLADLPYTKC